MPDALALPVPAAATGATPRREMRAFLNWLACWIALPNLPFLPITLMGGPPRYADIVACGVAGLIARRWPYGLRLAAFLVLLTYLTVTFIGRMFNLQPAMILSVVGLLADIRPSVSPEYVAGAVLLALTCAAAAWQLRQPGKFERPALLVAALGATLTLAAGDYLLSRDTMGAYARLAPADAPFESATEQTDFQALADGKANLMIVVVEAMGQPRDAALREKLAAMWQRPELAGRFEITRGETAFYGSTTGGEIRELCGRWGNYPDIVAADPRCLPAQLARRGYGTTAIHGFTPDFFDRERWHPLIGFQSMLFGKQLLAKGAAFCPNVFPGACDRDIPPIMAHKLAREAKPQFLYWLTLNSHLPIVENRALGTEHCRQLGAKADADFPMVCRLFAIWGDTADALARTVSAPGFEPTHILIVGDHMPPFTQQKSRLQFDSTHVPWILLRDRRAAQRPK